ncbi:DoxX family protein [Acrocarpospora catenulata]|uniref:DoxX family protein n=1 Tax=Acrocarpospora catenulata TaxID=2836182 RepID=UPI001BDB1085|nr:DoxX family protein [Acrocarpospora catenulata]
METDLAAFILRLALGPMLVAHGWNKLFGSGGLTGTQGWFEALGLRPAWLHARMAATVEIGAGVFLTLGLLTGLDATAYVALMVVATLTDHRGKGYFVFKGGGEYTILIAMASVGVAALGPGRWSLDHLLGLDLYGWRWAAIAAIGGTVAAAGLLATSYRPTETRP